MNTQIKFRIWDERYKEFRYWGFINQSFVGPPTGGGFSIDDCNKLSQPFTGKSDRNGTEMYPGDTVRFSHATDKEFPLIYSGTIKYDPNLCRFFIDGTGNHDCMGLAWKHIEVTGNIYEKQKRIKK